jgi:hypothetical protein
LIGAETDIKTIAAMHSQCRSWVKSGQTVAGQIPPLSAIVRKRTKYCGAANVRFVPKADIQAVTNFECPVVGFLAMATALRALSTIVVSQLVVEREAVG